MLSLLDLSGVGLEIGPGFSPLVPKSSGRRIETVDHESAAELREKYRNEVNLDTSRIEEVDYVSDGRPLGEIVNKQATTTILSLRCRSARATFTSISSTSLSAGQERPLCRHRRCAGLDW
jgi:hypothetical protein